MTKKEILRSIVAHFPRTRGKVEKTALGKGVIQIRTDHGKANRIGQFAMTNWPKQIETYFACHIFKQAHLAIYFKR